MILLATKVTSIFNVFMLTKERGSYNSIRKRFTFHVRKQCATRSATRSQKCFHHFFFFFISYSFCSWPLFRLTTAKGMLPKDPRPPVGSSLPLLKQLLHGSGQLGFNFSFHLKWKLFIFLATVVMLHNCRPEKHAFSIWKKKVNTVWPTWLHISSKIHHFSTH